MSSSALTRTSKKLLALLASRLLALALVCLCACQASPEPVEQPSMIGVTGGVVAGPGGATVTIPPDALAADTPIDIEQTSVGAPPLPAGLAGFGPMFALTPHGTRFAVPVTVTLPFDAAALPDGDAVPALYKTNADMEWEEVADPSFGDESVSAEITSFSFLQPVVPYPGEAEPVRTWAFRDLPENRRTIEEMSVPSPLLTQTGGELRASHTFGTFGAFPDPSSTTDPLVLLADDETAVGEVFSSASGASYSVFTEAPLNRVVNDPYAATGSQTELNQHQSYRKETDNASLKFTLTAAKLVGFDGNAVLGRCPKEEVCSIITGSLYFDVRATKFRREPGAPLEGGTPSDPRDLSSPPAETFFHTAGFVNFWGSGGAWDWDASNSTTPTVLWEKRDFDFVESEFNGPDGRASLTLKKSLPFTVDLSSLGKREGFTLWIRVVATAQNQAALGSEFETGAFAFLRDPISTDGGTILELSGLQPIPTPPNSSKPGEVLVPPAPCEPGPGPNADAGLIAFSAPTYTTTEFDEVPTVTVVRSGGTSGAVTATVTTSDGSAEAGSDYAAVHSTVFFGDGDATPRVVPVTILYDSTDGEVEADETVTLTLSEPGGCAALGAQTSAVLTIEADELPVMSENFSIGGTVSGLLGSGLVLFEATHGDVSPTEDGPFTFTQPVASGTEYSVTVYRHPTDPAQFCSVSQGEGTLEEADVTDIEVNCETVAGNRALDPSFGDEGKTSTPFGGDESDMAVQADGKIVMVGGSGSAFVLARYDADGNLDTDFGSDGLVTTEVEGGGAEAHGVALQADGKIVVAGFAFVSATSSFDFALVRYDSDGVLDPSFGSDGVVTTDFNGLIDHAFAVAIQPDGSILVAGSVGFDSASTGPFSDFGLARYLPDGSLDDSFGTGGKVTTDIIGGTDNAQTIVIQPSDGAILVAGRVTIAGDSSLSNTGLARYTPSGELDGSFGAGGTAALLDLSLGAGVALQEDGKILLAGSVDVGTGPDRLDHMALMRLLSDGSRDPDFGAEGLVTTRFSEFDDIGTAVAVQADGLIVVAGRAGQGSSESDVDFAVARYDREGAIDPSFGSDGKLTIDFFGGFDGAENVALQPDGKIVVSGAAENTRKGYALVRLAP